MLKEWWKWPGLVLVLLPVVPVLTGGCAQSTPDSRFVRDGIPYGETRGPFRARWWNYYERGTSFLQGGFWEEAESDLRTALAGRATDQRWARTYGLHFLPEYFPNRELGIALYHQGDFTGAADHLETSLGQQHSARAAHYLTRVRRAMVSDAGVDIAPPSFDPAGGGDSGPIGELEAVLKGTARDDTFVTGIWIDGTPYPFDVSAPEIPVEHPVSLHPGDNHFTVTVEDIVGRRSETVVAISVDSDGPIVSFDPIAPGDSTVSGVLYDPAGIAHMMVGAFPVRLQQEVDGSKAFAFPAAAIAEHGRDYLAADSLGNVTTGQVPLPAYMATSTHERIQVAQLGAGPGVLPRAASTGATSSPTPRVDILDPTDGRVVLRDQVAVAYELESPVPLEHAAINGAPLPLLPNRTVQRGSRRLLLPGEGPHTLTLEARDEDGNASVSSISIDRQESELERVGMLDAAFVGVTEHHALDTPGNGAAYRDAITSWLFREFYESRRFAGIRDRDPTALAAIVTEQELSAALSSKSAALALHQLVPAELIILGRMRQWPDSIELILEGKATEVAGGEDVITLAYADVAGTAGNREELEELVRVLVLRFLQQIPRVHGQVAQTGNQRLVSTLGEDAHGVRRHQKAVIYMQGDPITHPSDPTIILEEADILVLGEALITTVRSATSDLTVIRRNLEREDIAIERGHFVVTK